MNEYEYEYKSEAIDSSKTVWAKRQEVDANVNNMRSGSINKHEIDLKREGNQEVLETFTPRLIEIFLQTCVDKLGKKYIYGKCWGNQKMYRLDFYPTVNDYRFLAPGGVTKNTILHAIDEIRTEGRLSNQQNYIDAMPGRLGWAIGAKHTVHAKNIGVVLMPGVRTQYQLLWFEDGALVTEYQLHKSNNKLTYPN